MGVNKFIPKLIKLDYSHFDKLAFSANLDIPDCDIKDDIKLAGELRQYDPGVRGRNAALRFFFEVREALERSTQSTPQDLGKKTSSWGSGPVGTSTTQGECQNSLDQKKPELHYSNLSTDALPSPTALGPLSTPSVARAYKRRFLLCFYLFK